MVVAEPVDTSSRGPAVGDACVYLASAGFALWTAATTEFVTFETWARFAAPVYAIAGVAALGLAVSPLLDRHAMTALRQWLLGLAALGATVLPLVLLVHNRVLRGPDFANSEVAVVESAARLALRGQDPYTSSLGGGELVQRGSGVLEHFPYLPGMAVFGLPRAVLPGREWTDARVAFALVTVALCAMMLRVAQLSVGRRIRLWQLLVVLPPAALPLAAGGDDLPVVAACLAGFTFLGRGRRAAGVGILVAAAVVKPTAWPAAAAAAVLLWRGDRRAAVVLVAVPAAVVGSTLLLSDGAASDLLGYPLGLSAGDSPVTDQTLGSLLLAALPGGDTGVSAVVVRVLLLVAAGVVGECILNALIRARVLGPIAVADVVFAAARTATLWTALLLLAPAVRPGYLLYPMTALGWALLVARQPTATPLSPSLHGGGQLEVAT